ncbi:DUF3466 family protein [Vibrio ziniensis]|uniref:DUF3466 family protein n=1 Tax=Vibrio ziniensis TaxID=2711221 RepID=A0A6G7CI45_9VIBR|nr:DUF3466 family protein [Vibrio ziniensis]QIH41750.1 DUF3466 family protein [Vibrio ziniensis]
MNNNLFKLSIISAAILTATHVSAALYNVVEVVPSTSLSYESSFGEAIQPAATNSAADNCFVTSTIEGDGVDCSSYVLAGETRIAKLNAGGEVDGLSFREEAPFAMDSSFYYIQDYSDFDNYCEAQLGYSTCEQWATVRWDIWESEIDGDTTPNSIAFIEDESGNVSSVDSTESLNVVVNSISDSGTVIGIDSTAGDVTDYRRNSVEARTEGTAPSGYLQTRAWKTDGTYTVGSVSTSYENDYGTFYTSNPAIWDNDSGTVVEIPWPSGTARKSNRLAQGSIRDFVVDQDTNMIYAVGFNAYNSSYNYMNATVFSVSVDDYQTDTAWTSTAVNNAQVKIDGETIHSNSVVTSVNNNLIAIGSAKRLGSKPYNGAAANRLFIIDDVTAASPTAIYLSGGIVFSGSGGKAGAINNYNEIVGQLDFDDTREIDGKPRAKRGFIYPYDSTGSDSTRMERFGNKAWFLDDLTNDNEATSNNNQYRIIDATDINDAGVISGTALKCSGGYETTAHNSSCNGDESTVAVKLVPIVDSSVTDISERGSDAQTSKRSGAGLGLWGFILLGLAWFRRK